MVDELCSMLNRQAAYLACLKNSFPSIRGDVIDAPAALAAAAAPTPLPAPPVYCVLFAGGDANLPAPS